MAQKDNLLGKQFNRLKVVGVSKNKNGHTFWICKCICGKEKIIQSCALKSGRTKSCGCYNSEMVSKRKLKHGNCIGGPNPVYKMFQHARSRAKKEKLPFTLKLQDIKIPEFCPVFKNIQLKTNNRIINDSSPSLDKLIPEKGYTRENVRVISFKANRMKQNVKFQDIKRLGEWLENELGPKKINDNTLENQLFCVY